MANIFTIQNETRIRNILTPHQSDHPSRNVFNIHYTYRSGRIDTYALANYFKYCSRPFLIATQPHDERRINNNRVEPLIDTPPYFEFAFILRQRVLRYPSVVLPLDRKSTRLNSSHVKISYAVYCWKEKT